MIDSVSGNSINSMMETIRAYQQKAAGGIDHVQITPPQVQDIQAPKTELPNFTESVKNLLDKVNETQVKSNNLQEAYQRGEDVPLTDVVLGMQKSSLAFEATLQVRNKVLRAYEEIMNMPV
jgi:flagellar hook-basal body complex protein FliE